MFLAKVLHRLQLAGKLLPGNESCVNDDEDEEGQEVRQEVVLRQEVVQGVKWLIRRMSRLANYEAGHDPKQSIKVCQMQLEHPNKRHFHSRHFSYVECFLSGGQKLKFRVCLLFGEPFITVEPLHSGHHRGMKFCL